MMGIYYYTLFSLFAVIAIMITLDQNVGDYITILFKIFLIQIERLIWRIRFHPFWFSNPIGRRFLMRKYEKIIKKTYDETL